MFHTWMRCIKTHILIALLVIPTTIKPIDHSAVIASGMLVGVLCGTTISYFINEKIKDSENSSAQTQPNKLQRLLQKYPTLRTVLYIAIGASTGAVTSYGFLHLLQTIREKKKDKQDPTDNTVPKPRDETKEDRDWWHTLTQQSAFNNKAELQECNNQWAAAIEQRFKDNPEKLLIYQTLLKQLIPRLKQSMR